MVKYIRVISVTLNVLILLTLGGLIKLIVGGLYWEKLWLGHLEDGAIGYFLITIYYSPILFTLGLAKFILQYITKKPIAHISKANSIFLYFALPILFNAWIFIPYELTLFALVLLAFASIVYYILESFKLLKMSHPGF